MVLQELQQVVVVICIGDFVISEAAAVGMIVEAGSRLLCNFLV